MLPDLLPGGVKRKRSATERTGVATGETDLFCEDHVKWPQVLPF